MLWALVSGVGLFWALLQGANLFWALLKVSKYSPGAGFSGALVSSLADFGGSFCVGVGFSGEFGRGWAEMAVFWLGMGGKLCLASLNRILSSLRPLPLPPDQFLSPSLLLCFPPSPPSDQNPASDFATLGERSDELVDRRRESMEEREEEEGRGGMEGGREDTGDDLVRRGREVREEDEASGSKSEGSEE